MVKDTLILIRKNKAFFNTMPQINGRVVGPLVGICDLGGFLHTAGCINAEELGEFGRFMDEEANVEGFPIGGYWWEEDDEERWEWLDNKIDKL